MLISPSLQKISKQTKTVQFLKRFKFDYEHGILDIIKYQQ